MTAARFSVLPYRVYVLNASLAPVKYDRYVSIWSKDDNDFSREPICIDWRFDADEADKIKGIEYLFRLDNSDKGKHWLEAVNATALGALGLNEVPAPDVLERARAARVRISEWSARFAEARLGLFDLEHCWPVTDEVRFRQTELQVERDAALKRAADALDAALCDYEGKGTKPEADVPKWLQRRMRKLDKRKY